MTTKFDHDLGLRHRDGVKPEDFVRAYCQMLRPHAYATQDGSWNELEKTLAHILDMLCYHKRLCELLGMPADPRESVRRLEHALDVQEKAVQAVENERRAALGLGDAETGHPQ